MKKFVITFSVVLVLVIVGYTLLGANNQLDLKALESASGTEQKSEKPAAADKPAETNTSEVTPIVEQSKPNEAVLVKKGELNTSAKAQLLQNMAGDYYMGNEYAPVLMIEYASLSCPHCAHFQEAVLDDLIVSHINTGKVRYIYRDFPLNAPALDATKLSMCADKKNYFNFIKVLFKSQENWVMADDYKAVLKNIGKLGGVSEDQFDKCLADKTNEEKILKTKKDAIEILGVDSTPTIFINGVEYEGEHSYEAVTKYIDSLLKPAQAH